MHRHITDTNHITRDHILHPPPPHITLEVVYWSGKAKLCWPCDMILNKEGRPGEGTLEPKVVRQG